ncbi:MAG: helix-turn-helix transcriptional regulator [Gammaproteobacteria bacterium]|nr:helix-turn-helix transcriptional regulator [Gammaproteobacteria bacterium]MDE0248909.1 helix-turn-helix transcriptional regulator [Gammaproteobacteria bacterium]
MSERRAFDRILASLHEATLDDALWPVASALIDDAFRAKGNSLVFGSGRTEEGVQIFSARFFRGGERLRESEREYFGVYHPVDERLPRLRLLPDSRLVRVADLYTEKEMRTSPAYNEALIKGHLQNGLNVRLDGPNGSRIVWTINDPVDTDGWSSARVESIRRLLPHIRHYVNVRHALAGAGALGASLDELLAVTGSGVIQLDGRGRIVAANDHALGLLRAGDALFDEDGFLSARSPEDDADLEWLLTRVLPAYGRRGAAGSMTVRRQAALEPLRLHVHPVGRKDTEYRAWPVAALVLVVDQGSGTRIDPNLVAAALGLTPTEGRVAAQLAEGRTVGEIASATGRKVSTVRTHVRHIFSKHGITRQVDLVRLVLSISASPPTRR